MDLKVPSGHIGPAWEWHHWIGLEKDINRYRFFIFYFWSWIFDKSSKFWADSCKNESNLLLVWNMVCMCSNLDLFRQTELQKCSRDINIPQSKPKRGSTLVDFASNKSAPANRKTGFYANCDQTVVRWIHFCTSGSELWSLFKYSRVKLKKSKCYSGWCPFQGLSNGTTLM